MSKISSLTPEQQAKIPFYVDKWTKIGFDCSPLNREKAIEAMNEIYICAGKPAPKKIYFGQSPLVTLVMVNMYWYMKETGIKDKAKVIAYVKKNCQFSTCGYGAHDAGWLAFYDFFRNEVGLKEETEKLSGLFKGALELGWYWAYDDVCFISEKPTELHYNDRFELHNENGPAIAWSDNVKYYYVNGVAVPDFVIEKPETITINHIEKEDNAEIRRIMTDKYGVGRYLADVKAEIVDADMVTVDFTDAESLPMPRSLMRIKNGQQYLVGTDGSTKRAYFMSVDPAVKTCKQAHESISGGIKDENIIASS
jgi:hypothetical protein